MKRHRVCVCVHWTVPLFLQVCAYACVCVDHLHKQSHTVAGFLQKHRRGESPERSWTCIWGTHLRLFDLLPANGSIFSAVVCRLKGLGLGLRWQKAFSRPSVLNSISGSEGKVTNYIELYWSPDLELFCYFYAFITIFALCCVRRTCRPFHFLPLGQQVIFSHQKQGWKQL